MATELVPEERQTRKVPEAPRRTSIETWRLNATNIRFVDFFFKKKDGYGLSGGII
jgi:hypothetical protein